MTSTPIRCSCRMRRTCVGKLLACAGAEQHDLGRQAEQRLEVRRRQVLRRRGSPGRDDGRRRDDQARRMRAVADAQLPRAVAAHQVGAGGVFELELHDLTILHASREFTAAPVTAEACPDGGRARARRAALVAGGAGRDVGERLAAGHARAALARRAWPTGVRRARRLAPVVARARRRLGSPGALARRAGARAGNTDPAHARPAQAPGASRSRCISRPASITCGSRRCAAGATRPRRTAGALGATFSSHFGDRRTDRRGSSSGRLAVALRGDDRLLDSHDRTPSSGHNVHDFMPAGRDGARVRSLMNEMQMLLHEHPVNERREQRRDCR